MQTPKRKLDFNETEQTLPDIWHDASTIPQTAMSMNSTSSCQNGYDTNVNSTRHHCDVLNQNQSIDLNEGITPLNLGYRQFENLPRRREREPDKFNGESDFGLFISHFEQVAKYNRWSELDKAQNLAICLRGRAQCVLEELSQTELSHYSCLREALNKRFHPSERTSSYKFEFRNKRRNKQESLLNMVII
jgi:hypothetical protein